MASRVGLAILFFVIGSGSGVLGYAIYRGDVEWQSPSTIETEPPDVAAAPAPKPKAAKESLPELPISLSYYENRQGPGYVVQIHNHSQKHLAVLIELENPTLDQEISGALNLAPGQMQEISAAQGWRFASGESIRVKQEGHQTASLTIP